MKRFAAAIAGAALVLALPAGIKTEYANAATETVYPEFVSTLDIGNITCYSSSGDGFALVGDNSERDLYVYAGGNLTYENESCVIEGGMMESCAEGLYAYRHSTDISAVWYSGGTLYFGDKAGQTYSYSEGTVTESNEVYTTENTVDFGHFTAYITNGQLNIIDISVSGSAMALDDGVYSNVSSQPEGAFVIKDGKLCIISGQTLETLKPLEVQFRFIDRSHEQTIATGESAAALKAVGQEALFVTVTARQYVTEIDIDNPAGEYFSVSGNGTFLTDSSMQALVLCTTGNADILAVGEKTYITAHNEVTSAATTSPAPFAHGQLNYSSGVYSSPYMCGATELAVLEPGTKVEVLYKINKADNAALATDFCRIKFTDANGAEAQGYVAAGFLTAYDFTGDDGEFGEPETPEDYSEKNAIITVVLVLIIVVLVIAGVAYLAYTGGAEKRKKKNEQTAEDDSDNYEE